MTDSTKASKDEGSTQVKITAAERLGYEEQLRGGLAFQAAFDRLDEWAQYVEIMGHNFRGNDLLEGHAPTVNLLAARVRAQPPRLAYGVPTFNVTAYGRPPSPNSEAAIAARLKQIWEQEAFDDVTRQVTQDWPLFGLGIGFVGYESAKDCELASTRRRLFGFVPTGITEAVSRATDGASDKLSKPEDRRTKLFRRERIFLERVSPVDFVMDPCGRHWDGCQFMARRLSLPQARAEAMFGVHTPKQKSATAAVWRGSVSGEDGMWTPTDLESRLPDSIKRISVWELWDIVSRRTIYLCAESRKVIGPHVYDWKAPHPGFPFVAMLWDEMPDDPYPMSLSAAILPQNEELHLIRQRHIAEVGKAIGKWRVSSSVFNDRDAKEALLSDIDGDVVRAEEGDIEPLTFTSIPPEHFAVEAQIRRDIDEVTHTSPFDAGTVSPYRPSATEATIVQSGSDAVAMWRKTSVERFASQVAERVLAYLLTVADEPVPLRIINNDENHLILDKDGHPVFRLDAMGLPLPALAAKGELIDYMFTGIEHAGAYNVKTIEDTMSSMAKDTERMQLIHMFDRFVDRPWFKAREAAAHIVSLSPSVRDPHKFIMTEEEYSQAAAAQAPPMAPDKMGMMAGMGGAMPDGLGSGNMTADMAAGMMGAVAPGTGFNGMGGADNQPKGEVGVI